MPKRRLTILLLLTCVMPAAAQDGLRMEDVVRSPADYAGKTLVFRGVTLSGAITTYDVAGVRKYYLTVGSRARTIEPGFFLAPPNVADQLYEKTNRSRNYIVNLTCRIEKIVLNDVPQWHGIVARVDFLDGDGQIVDTVKDRK